MVMDAGPTATPHKSEAHDNIVVHGVSGRKDARGKQPVNDTDGAGAGERVMEMESARNKKKKKKSRAAVCF